MNKRWLKTYLLIVILLNHFPAQAQDASQYRFIIAFQCHLIQEARSWRQSFLHQLTTTLEKNDSIQWERDFSQCSGILTVHSQRSSEQLIRDFEQLTIVRYAEEDLPMHPAQQEVKVR